MFAEPPSLRPVGMMNGFFQSLGWLVWGLAKKLLSAVWAVFRPAIKVVSVVALIGAIVALTSDFTRWQTGEEGPLFQSLAGIATDFAPATFEGLGKAVAENVHPLAWDPVLVTVFNLPAWVVLFAITLATGFVARERRHVDIFVN